jgi:hypothetical protein
MNAEKMRRALRRFTTEVLATYFRYFVYDYHSQRPPEVADYVAVARPNSRRSLELAGYRT